MKHREGTRLVCELPKGYDDQTRIAEFNGHIVVAHPNFQPCIIKNGKLIPIVPYEGIT